MLKAMKRTIVEAGAALAADPVERLRTKHAAAVAELVVARQALGAAVLDAETQGGARDAKGASAALASAQARVDELAAAIEAAEARKAAEAQRAAEAETKRRWDLAMEHVERRARAAADAQAAIEALADARNRLLTETSAILGTCPSQIDPDGALLRPADIDARLRVEMARASIRFAASWLTDPGSQPSLASKITDANNAVAFARKQAGQ